MIKQFYNYILKIGQSNESTTLGQKKVKLLNNYTLVAMHFAILMPIADTITGLVTINFIICYAFMLLCMVMVLVLNSKNKYKLGCYLWMFNVIFTIFIFSVFLFPEAYNEYYYVFIPGISLTLFPYNKSSFFVFILCFILFLFPYYVTPVYSTDIINKLDPMSVFGIFTCIYVLFNYFNSNNIESEKKLIKAYSELEKTKKTEHAHLQLKSLKAQMNPHFMFNTLNSIQSLILKEDKVEAYNYVTKFSAMIRENLNMSEKSFVSFDEELSLLKKYLELEKLRFKDSFEYQLNVNEEIINHISIPSMLIQPFVENAIKHGLLHKQDGIRKIEIDFQQDKNILSCIITDNGIGLKASKIINQQNNSGHKSFSTSAIEQRLNLLKDYYGSNIGFEYVDVQKGTKVIVKIPYES